MIRYRIRQFLRAIFAEIREEEIEFIVQHLSPVEQELFFQMSIVDQRHVLDVSYEVKRLFLLRHVKEQGNEEIGKLLKASLLHDVGKKAGDLTLLDRVLIVLVEIFCPSKLQEWSAKGRGNFLRNRRHAFYVALHHGQLGAELLKEICCEEEVINIVKNHHISEVLDWQIELLKEADHKF